MCQFFLDDWHKLDNDVRAMSADVSCRHTISAMSRYDAEYLQYYTGKYHFTYDINDTTPANVHFLY